MNEHSFRNTIRTQAKRFDPSMLIWKINDNFAGGVPDYLFERHNQERWVEAKYLKNLPKRPSTLLDFTNPNKFLSDLQVDWLNRREQRFGDACVVIGIGERRCETALVLRHGAWNTPMTTTEVRQKTIPPAHIFTKLFD
jgi:hypothetical protein